MILEPNISAEPTPLHMFSKHLQGSLYKSFLKKINPANIDFACCSFPVDSIDPLACLDFLTDDKQFRFFWENPDALFSIAAGNRLLELRSEEAEDRFSAVSSKIQAVCDRTAEFTAIPHRNAGLHFLGGFSFFDQETDPRWEEFGPASFTVPEWLLVRQGSRYLLTVIVPVEDRDHAESIDRKIRSLLHFVSQVYSTDSDLSLVNPGEQDHPGLQHSFIERPERMYEKWTSSVQKATRLIEKEVFNKIVLAREYVVSTDCKLSPVQIIHTLRKQYSDCYSFLIHKEKGGTFIGSTPERLASFRGNNLLTEALAGSIQRGNTPTEDKMLERRLLESTKNSEEHYFVVKAIKQKLQSFVLDIELDEQPAIKKLPNVQHLHTPITTRLKTDTDRLALIGALHPTPAVGGYPWREASEYIKELEEFSRGWYAGPVGWINSRNDGEFSVAIRSGLIENKEARFYAGCGIVAGSEPDAEWQETNLKLMPLLSALRYD